MRFTLIESLSLPSDAARPNEDAFSNTENFAAVLDGATGLGEQLMPGPSDAQWIARFGANRLASHARSGMGGPRDWLRHAMADARKSFEALRRRPPNETYEIAFASIMAATLRDDVLQTLWLGDCSALLCDRDGGVRLLGDAQNARERERARVASIMLGQGGDPAAQRVRPEFLPALRKARNTVNTPEGSYLFGPDPVAAKHLNVARRKVAAGTTLLLATDGFFALVSDYDAYTTETLMQAAASKGLSALGEELRAIEMGDPEGRRFARFKRHDDATALLLRVDD